MCNEILRVMFDAADVSGADCGEVYDLIVVPAAWPDRAEMFLTLVRQLLDSGRPVELTLELRAEDRPLRIASERAELRFAHMVGANLRVRTHQELP